MRISDWSSDVCSSDLNQRDRCRHETDPFRQQGKSQNADAGRQQWPHGHSEGFETAGMDRSEEHTSEPQSLMRISYAVFCLKKKNQKKLRTSQDLYTAHITIKDSRTLIMKQRPSSYTR